MPENDTVPKAVVVRLLKMLAGEPTPCKKCGRPVWFLKMLKSGKMNPFTDEAVSHFADCVAADTFRKD
jgi:hypothetical protein